MSNLNIAELLEDFEESKGSDNGPSNFLDNFVLMPENEGVVVVRILPPGNNLPLLHGGLCMSTRLHTINGRKVHCRREKPKGSKYYTGDCRICDHYNWLYREADNLRSRDKEKADQNVRQARMIKPVERYYFNAIVRKMRKKNGEDEFNVGPRILSVGKTIFERIRRAILGDNSIPDAPEPALGDITSLTNGRDFRIVKEIKKSEGDEFPNYDKSKFVDPSPAGTADQIKVWMNNLHDLASLRVLKTTEEVEHELRIHLGYEQDTRTNTYNPSMLQGRAPFAPATMNVNHNAEVFDECTPYTPESFEETPNLALDDAAFYQAMKNIGG